jgi:hypothetical protein
MSKAPRAKPNGAQALTVTKVYRPDREAQARAIFRLAGLKPAEIERVITSLRDRREIKDETGAPAS